jgi:predicted O-linked N-acetylglucosamine transferase (SPINDLY family)
MSRPPPDSDVSVYAEKTVRLPQTFWCYPPPPEAPAVGPPPVRRSGRITFGCLNTFSKVTAAVLATWCDLLKRLPQAALVMRCPAGSAQDRVRQCMSRNGLDAARVTFVRFVPLAEYFPLYHNIDIALDAFPYAGGTTTCDALWMGVPVVTLRGRTAVGRGGVSILSNIGLPEFIATTTDQYIRIARDLAGDLPRLAELRRTMRERMRRSPLMDEKRFARNVEAAYRRMWEEWCRSAGS